VSPRLTMPGSFRDKVTWLVATISAVAIASVAIVLSTVNHYDVRNAAFASLHAQARVAALNSGAPLVFGDRVFSISIDNKLHAMAAVDGSDLWNFTGLQEVAGYVGGNSAAGAADVIVAPFSSGELVQLRVQNGQAAWNDVLSKTGHVTQLSEIDAIAGRPVIDRDMVFAISQSGVLVALRLSTGERAWSKQVGGIQTPWVAGDYLYVITNNAELICLTRKEGKVRWIHQLPAFEKPEDKKDPILWAGPVLVSDRLVVTSSNGYAETISPYDGRLLGRVEIPEGTTIAPVVANGTLYIYTRDADLVALR